MKPKKLAIVLIVIWLVIAGTFIYRYKIMMKPAQTTPAEFERIAIGSDIKVVCEITEMEGDKLTLEVLTGAPDYNKRTDSFLQAVGVKDAKIIMGKLEDIKKGGIAQFSGIKVGDNQLSLERIVILTNFIKGLPPRL